jgi:cellulase
MSTLSYQIAVSIKCTFILQPLKEMVVKWASDKLIAQNYTWTSRIPSDIKAGTYILRHELVALHDGAQQYNGRFQSGAQFYPVCYNVEVVGTGTATPPGQTFPGMYSVNDPGIKVKIADVINSTYVSHKCFDV